MKRRRKHESTERAFKRPKLEGNSDPHPTTALLRQYYAHVTTLRQYLAVQLSKGSKKRSKKVLHHGLSANDEPSVDTAVVELLDKTLVGHSGSDISDVESLEQDITTFTQQLTASTTAVSPTQGALKQTEIVDFVIWAIFKRQCNNRRPSHLLGYGYQRTTAATDSVELEVLPGVPGVLASCRNDHVERLKEAPWVSLPALVGAKAEGIISGLLLGCGIFSPVGDSSNVVQISGMPMSDLKLIEAQQNGSFGARKPNRDSSGNAGRGLGDIRIVRHRMLYARPTLTTKGQPRFGLHNSHVLHRLHDIDDCAETAHIMKYIFPRQFGLHNVFTFDVDRSETAQPLKDYTLRDKEIAKAAQRLKQKRAAVLTSEPAAHHVHLPRRLRGAAVKLIQRIRRKHARCPYHALLQHHCPSRTPKHSTKGGSIRQASTAAEVSALCRAVVCNVFPKDIWGTRDSGNDDLIMQSIDKFVRLRRYESMSLHDVLQHFNIKCVPWLAPPKTDENAKLSKTDFFKRQELMAEVVYYLFDSFLIPLIRGTFHVTESNVHRNQLFCFRHDVWQVMTEPALSALKTSMLEECDTATVRSQLATRALGVSQVRLLPKEQGMRPIINLRRRIQRLRHGDLVLGKSINTLLTPAFSILNLEKSNSPEMLGSALFSVDDMFPRLQAFRASLVQQGYERAPLYFAKVDVQACFDTIPQKRLMALARTIIHEDSYHISRYSRVKLLGDHNDETPGFGAKPSWKFLTKASARDKPFKMAEETAADTHDGRNRTLYIDGAVQRSESRKAILDILQEHIEANLIRIGGRFYRLKQGIPQGSIVSSLLCSYIYAELEREMLAFLGNGRTLLLRLIDDFLIISTERGVAERFMQVMHAGIPDFGVQVKAEKSRSNFDVFVKGKQIARLPERADFPYCGNAINTVTLDLSKDHERRRKGNLADSVTVEFSKLPGQTFYRKTLNALKLQMHVMLLSTKYNSLQTVFANLYHSFSEVAQKSYHYIRSLPTSGQPGDKLLIRTLDDTIKLACVLMRRRKRTGKDALPYECGVSNAQARWLSCTAFHTVFHQRQTRYHGVLAWFQAQLQVPEVNKQGKLLEPVAKAYT